VSTNAKSELNPGRPARPQSEAALAALALDTLAGLEPELKAAVVLSDDGRILAATPGDDGWGVAAAALLAELEKAGEGDLDSSHITTEDAEVFVVRESGVALVAVTARFVLASLTSFDVRMALRSVVAVSGEIPADQGAADA
jgi:hypothetical protein